MDRREWGEIVGDHGYIADDLRWELFQADRIIETQRREERHDTEMFRHFSRRQDDAKFALATLWARDFGGD